MVLLGLSTGSSFRTNRRRVIFAAGLLAVLPGILMLVRKTAATPAPVPAGGTGPSAVPQYDKDGQLFRPKDFYTWTFVGSSIGLSYAKGSDPYGPGMFHNVYTQPEAYREFLKTGKFPEKTIFIIEMHDSQKEVSIAKNGYTEGESMGLDVSVKDHSRFSEGWAYYNFESSNGNFAEKARAHSKDQCFSCHAAHGASDNVFTQFYPVLRRK